MKLQENKDKLVSIHDFPLLRGFNSSLSSPSFKYSSQCQNLLNHLILSINLKQHYCLNTYTRTRLTNHIIHIYLCTLLRVTLKFCSFLNQLGLIIVTLGIKLISLFSIFVHKILYSYNLHIFQIYLSIA